MAALINRRTPNVLGERTQRTSHVWDRALIGAHGKHGHGKLAVTDERTILLGR